MPVDLDRDVATLAREEVELRARCGWHAGVEQQRATTGLRAHSEAPYAPATLRQIDYSDSQRLGFGLEGDGRRSLNSLKRRSSSALIVSTARCLIDETSLD